MPSISIPVAAAGIGAAGAIGSSLISSNAASNAASTQQQTAGQALALQQQEYNQTVANEAPYLQSGDAALTRLDTMYGLNAPAASAAASGQPVSGTAASPMVVGAGKNNQFAGVSEGGITQATANSILSTRPDVQSAYSALPASTQASFGSPQAYAAYWDNKYDGGSYQIPGTAATTAAPSYTNAAGGQSTVDPNASFYLSPDYNFALTQGLKGLDASYASQGLSVSGAAAKAAIQYSSGLATQDYQNYAATLKGLAAGGQSAASNQTAAGGTYAALGTGTLTGLGSNLAAGQVAQGTIGNNLSSSLAGIANSYLQNSGSLMNSSFSDPTGWTNGPPSSLYTAQPGG